jgi:hypothetical protein
MSIVIDSLVRVTSKETSYLGKCGKVAEIIDDGDEDGPIGVRFDREDIATYVSTDEECVVRFEPSELEIITDFPVEHIANTLFRHSHHTVEEFTFVFSPKNDCMFEDCPQKATRRAVTNIWGRVIERDVCDEHYDMCHGKCGELFQMSDEYALVENIPRTSK